MYCKKKKESRKCDSKQEAEVANTGLAKGLDTRVILQTYKDNMENT